MDKDAERKKLEDAANVIADYLEHPITKELRQDASEREEAVLKLICEIDIFDMQTFFMHFQAVGELQALRRQSSMLPARLKEIQENIKEI